MRGSAAAGPLDDRDAEDPFEPEVATQQPGGARARAVQLLAGHAGGMERGKLAALDDFVSAACPFCGDLMIQSIAEPFVTQDERDDAKEWAI